jgi:hypothetical protein
LDLCRLTNQMVAFACSGQLSVPESGCGRHRLLQSAHGAAGRFASLLLLSLYTVWPMMLIALFLGRIAA